MDSNRNDDLSDAVAPTVVDQNTVAALQSLLAATVSLEDHKAQLEADLIAVNKALQIKKESEIPGLMDQLGMPKLTVGGYDVEVQERISGGLPSKDPDLRQQAVNYLQQIGGEQILKTVVSVALPVGENEKAKVIYDWLKANGYQPSVKEDVHAMTLQAWARERLDRGEVTEYQKLGLHCVRAAKFKAVKSKK